MTTPSSGSGWNPMYWVRATMGCRCPTRQVAGFEEEHRMVGRRDLPRVRRRVVERHAADLPRPRDRRVPDDIGHRNPRDLRARGSGVQQPGRGILRLRPARDQIEHRRVIPGPAQRIRGIAEIDQMAVVDTGADAFGVPIAEAREIHSSSPSMRPSGPDRVYTEPPPPRHAPRGCPPFDTPPAGATQGEGRAGGRQIFLIPSRRPYRWTRPLPPFDTPLRGYSG